MSKRAKKLSASPGGDVWGQYNGYELYAASQGWLSQAVSCGADKYGRAMKTCLSDITPLTMLDYPGQAACIFWLMGCNMRCRYCYNADLAAGRGDPRYTRTDAVDFLEERAGFLDAVVFSGGECTLSPDLPYFAVEAKKRGFLVKVDTNGTRPQVVKYLIQEGLVDYIALDYKAPRHLFGEITGRSELYRNFSQTLDYLIETGFPFEVRTTLHPDLLTESDISLMNADLAVRGYERIHYIQHYFHTEDNLGHLQRPVRNFDCFGLEWNVPYEFRDSGVV